MGNLKNVLNKRKFEAMGAILLALIVAVPMLTFASSHQHIYVDASATGLEDGSQARPYHTISEALKHAKDNTDVHVAKGNYEDNLEIPDGVSIFGSAADEVIIRAKNSKKVVVSMQDDTRLNKVTVEKGKNGIWVEDDAKVSIVEVVVKNNDGDGIKIEAGKVSNKKAVSISDSKIKDNGKSGIYAGKRRVVLINNDITGNEKDGVDLAAGSSSWIEKNGFEDNDGSGLKLTLDGSNIWTKNNSFKNNEREGIEVKAYGKTGRIDINKSQIKNNHNFGISRVLHGGSSRVWSGLTVQGNTEFKNNRLGNIR